METLDHEKMSLIKKFWDNQPCNIRHSNKQIGTIEYFDEVEHKKHRAEPHILTFAEFEKWKGKRVLEIGCGIGTATTCFARNGAHVTAIDISEVSVKLCKQRLRVCGLDATIIEANAETLNEVLPITNNESARFDLVYSFGVIHHTPNPKAVIKQMYNYVKPDGEIRIMLYSFVSYKIFQLMHETKNWNVSGMRELIRTCSEAQPNCPCTHVYTFDEIHELLNPYFTVTKMWKDHIFIYDIEEYKKGNFVKSEAWKGVSDEQIKQMERELGWHTLVIATPNV
jgi:SAM-dependent methyltransferase